MDKDNMPTDADFLSAFETEMGVEPSAPTPPEPVVPEPVAPVEPVKPEVPEPVVPPVPEPVAPIAPVVPEPDKPEAPVVPETPEEPKYATAEDVKNAIREINTETTAKVEKLHSAREQVISAMYPEGIDRNIYDTNGKAIKTAQDIVDRGLINDRTQEPYTYEEAASFVLEANRKMDENIEELNRYAGDIAEKNINLLESSNRVMEKWGDIITAMPELAKEWAERYTKTQLQFDKTGNYITNMAMSPEDFYDLVAGPYRKMNENVATQQAAQAAEAARVAAEAAAQAEADQSERSGLPPQRGQSHVKANTGDNFLDALLDELDK